MKGRKTGQAKLIRKSKQDYHHGALREALIAATDEILRESGAEGFKLREAARRAGVSAAAPVHHFGSAAGLLTEVAILGFEELTRYLRQSGSASDPAVRLRAQGTGYVRFALAHPGRFHLMFRRDLVLPEDERLKIAGESAFAELELTIRAQLGGTHQRPNDRSVRASLIAAWSLVHGFAHLALDGKFDTMSEPLNRAKFVSSILPDVLLTVWPDHERREK